jgi:hypothetical protein
MLTRSYYSATAPDFLRASPTAVLGELVAHHTFAVDQNQRNAWQAEILHLQEVANALTDSFFFLEFAIPRMGKRADAVIISDGYVLVIEYKVGADNYQKHAIDQVLDYALDLKNFHEGSHSPTIVPILVATKAPALPVEVQSWADGVIRPILANRETLLPAIQILRATSKSEPVDAERGPHRLTNLRRQSLRQLKHSTADMMCGKSRAAKLGPIVLLAAGTLKAKRWQLA